MRPRARFLLHKRLRSRAARNRKRIISKWRAAGRNLLWRATPAGLRERGQPHVRWREPRGMRRRQTRRLPATRDFRSPRASARDQTKTSERCGGGRGGKAKNGGRRGPLNAPCCGLGGGGGGGV